MLSVPGSRSSSVLLHVSTETVQTVRYGDLDFHTAPELCRSG